MDVEKYYDLSDLTNAVVAARGGDTAETRDILKHGFEQLAIAVARTSATPGEYNPVVLAGIGSFGVEAIQGRRYLVNDEFIIKPMRYKVEFYPAEKFRNLVQANLPDNVKHLQVI